MMNYLILLGVVVCLLRTNVVNAWGLIPRQQQHFDSVRLTSDSKHYNVRANNGATTTNHRLQTKLDAAIGIFYGTSTGNTFDCAEKIYNEFGNDIASEPIDIDSLDSEQLVTAFTEHNALIVGTPTWNTGADEQRSGTGWDEIYYTKLPTMKNILNNKKVAVFGLGDQSSYSSNFADATGELYDVFTGLGCNMIDASWNLNGYEHDASKSIRNNKFCGLILDMINQEDLTDERIQLWVQQLKQNGILDGAGSSDNTAVAPVSASKVEVTITPSSIPSSDSVSLLVDSHSVMNGSTPSSSTIELAESIIEQVVYTAHANPLTGKTMWTSSDGKKSFFTSE